MTHIMQWKRRVPGMPHDPDGAGLSGQRRALAAGWLSRRRPWRQAAADRKGVAALEMALVLPVLCLVMLGILYTGILFNNFIELSNAVRVASRVLAESRGGTTPYTGATGVAVTSAPNLKTLTASNFTLTVNGKSCGSDGACTTALSTAQGLTSSVAATYPCNMTFYGKTFIPNSTLSAATTERVE